MCAKFSKRWQCCELKRETSKNILVYYNNLQWNKANILKCRRWENEGGREVERVAKWEVCKSKSIPKLIFNKKLWHLNGYKYGIFSLKFSLCISFYSRIFSFVSFDSSSSIGNIIGHWLQSNGCECIRYKALARCEMLRFPCSMRQSKRSPNCRRCKINQFNMYIRRSQPAIAAVQQILCQQDINYISEHVNYMQNPCKDTLTLPTTNVTSFFSHLSSCFSPPFSPSQCT